MPHLSLPCLHIFSPSHPDIQPTALGPPPPTTLNKNSPVPKPRKKEGKKGSLGREALPAWAVESGRPGRVWA